MYVSEIGLKIEPVKSTNNYTYIYYVSYKIKTKSSRTRQLAFVMKSFRSGEFTSGKAAIGSEESILFGQ